MKLTYEKSIEYWDASTTNSALRDRIISVDEVLEHSTKRAEQFQHLNALVAQPTQNELSAVSSEVQRRLDAGDTSRLLGVPTTVKDVIAVAGMGLSAGSRLLKDNRSAIDAGVVLKLREAGVMFVGKTNCPEFAFGISTSNDLYGTTLSPWGQNLSPGGSSGGDAVSVAVGISLVGVGTDFGGSIRWPAQCTGILGLRPTPGLISGVGQLVGTARQGIDGASQLAADSFQAAIQVPGFLARSVNDLENVVSAARQATAGTRSLSKTSTDTLDTDLSAVTIGWSDGSNIGVVGDDVKAMMLELSKTLTDDGLNLKYFGDAFAGAREAFDDLRGYEQLYDLRELAHGRESELSRASYALLTKPPRSRDGYVLAKETYLHQREVGREQLRVTPLFLLPVAGCGAIGHDETACINGITVAGFELMAHCRAISLLGVPVVSIPVAKTANGLPLSVQIVAPPFREDLALALARRIESLSGGWQPISGL